jgi:hypothetical protein
MGNTQDRSVQKAKDIENNLMTDEDSTYIDNQVKDYQTVINEYLTDLYYDPAQPGSFSGLQKLWKIVKSDNDYGLTYGDVKEWLSTQETYKRHKPVKRLFKRQRIIMSAIDQQWDADIMDMVKFSRQNNGYRYLAIFIDIFSRYIWVEPLKTKKPIEMVQVMKEIFSEGRRPLSIRTDRGSEYMGKEVQKYLSEMEILHFTARNALHANYAERLIRTLKGKIYRYFTRFQTHTYIDVIDDIVEGYLHTIHTTTQLKPIDINSENEQSVYEKLYLPAQVEQEQVEPIYKFDVGDYVYTLESRSPFTKGYEETFTQEIFEIVYRTPTMPPRYKLIDLKGESIAGTFYEQELLYTVLPDVFRIEKIIRRRVRNKRREALVRWQGYPDKFNEWILEKDIGANLLENSKKSA